MFKRTVGFVLLVMVGNVQAAIMLDGFQDLMGGYTYTQNLQSYIDYEDWGCDNLMWENPNTDVVEVVPKVGFWRLAAVKLEDTGAYVVGFANTDNYDSNNEPGWEGFLSGDYTENLGIGNRPDEVWIVWDQNGDGIGTYDSGSWFLGADDLMYDSGDILFGESQVRGDVSQMPTYTGSGTAILPQMVVSPIPEPNVDVGRGR